MRACASSGSPLWQKCFENGRAGGGLGPPSCVDDSESEVELPRDEGTITECMDSAIGEENGGEEGGG